MLWSFFLSGFLTAPINTLSAAGAKVTIVLQTRQQITGELLAVLDSEVIISRTVLLSEEKLKADSEQILRLRSNEIQGLTLNGKSYILDGTLLGCIAGIAIGALLSYEPRGVGSYGSNFDPYGPGPNLIIIGFVGGAIAGGLLGLNASGRDQNINLEGRKNLIFLRDFARYREARLPLFLRKSQ